MSYSLILKPVYLTDRKEVDASKLCGMVLLDLQNTFDTVNYGILLNKLRAVGFSEVAIKWVQSYITGRHQKVDIKGHSQVLSP